jgi:hypothetical protein
MYTNRLILGFLRFVRLPGINNLLIPGPPWAYVFDHLDQERWKWTAADRKVAEEISSYWVNFANHLGHTDAIVVSDSLKPRSDARLKKV